MQIWSVSFILVEHFFEFAGLPTNLQLKRLYETLVFN
jgi:hypothetical protein